MQKIYHMQNLGCANCAAKMEARFNALPEVEQASVVFATRQLRLTARDPDALVQTLQQIARSIEPEVSILPREEAASGDRAAACGCGHDHGHDHGDCDCGHVHEHKVSREQFEENPRASDSRDVPGDLLAGVGLFGGGLLLQWLGLPLAGTVLLVAAYAVLGRGVLSTAWGNLRRGHVFDENFLMSLATLGAFCIGELPEAVGVMLFYRVGAYFEHRAVERSRRQIMEAVDLRPETVNLVRDGQITVIPARQARAGDVLLVRSGDRIPLDAVVLSGESRLDTAAINGEPVPLAVRPGSEVLSGCVNLGAVLTVRACKPLSESMVTRILDSVENAAAGKPRMDRFITRFARVYTPVVVALAVLTAVVPSLLTGDRDYWVYTALSFLVMSCPCALVLSVPLAFFSGIGRGSRRGILFKDGLTLEALADVKAVVLDKTGTLTRGDFTVTGVTGEDTLAVCAGCEAFSSHPIAASILAHARQQGIAPAPVEKVEELPGRGIRGQLAGKPVLCGSAQLLQAHGIACPEASGDAATVVWLAVDGSCRGRIVISDTLKPGAAEAVAGLKKAGVEVAMLTGDRADSAEAVARQVGISRVHAELLPQQKLERLAMLRERFGPVMFVGDGINDAPVLSGADVGAAMGSGADAAIEAADVVFMTGDPAAVEHSLRIARQTGAVAWQNVVFALAVKLAVMVLGLLGHASMWLAVFADSGVALLCVLNSLRALYRK